MIEPATEAELTEAVSAATRPLSIKGGGTRGILGPDESDVLSTRGLSGITLYEPGALTIVAGAGTPMSEIEEALASEGQMLPFEPMDHRGLLETDGTPTLGGVTAANVSGPRRLRAGACRDSLIGVRFVDGSGEILKNGGRVMKNVTGYDLVKLMAGSYGTLGVLSEVSFKLLPKVDAVGTISLEGLSPSAGVAAMSAALASPFEVSGAAMTDVTSESQSRVHLRLEGFETSVRYRAEKLQKTLAKYAESNFTLEDADVWTAVRDVHAFAAKPNVWRASIKGGDAPALLEALGDVAEFEAMFDWGGGLVWLATDSVEDEAEVFHKGLQSEVARVGGHAMLVKAPASLKRRVPVFQPENPALQTLAKGLRNQFDPRGILNTGVMG